ncbi:hypothetical protein LSH36_969g00035 [Paralvinella palmiformis]|uniref:Uncharacterized protein n=1 Tax=Paralvinella palmiformis TaxID=53620 RepID=A0AAD9IWP2_9ANNE|nr:hypothetical protein LSH36_969g00035 [Paralvinella palmiformis]
MLGPLITSHHAQFSPDMGVHENVATSNEAGDEERSKQKSVMKGHQKKLILLDLELVYYTFLVLIL